MGEEEETAVNGGNYSNKEGGVKAEGKVDTIKRAGTNTGYEKTDEAEEKRTAGTDDALRKDPEKLKGILLYHVVSGKVMAAQVVKMKTAKSVEGGPIMIMAKGGKVMVDNANVVKTDIACDNGVIHVIDTVIMPPPTHN